MSELIPIGVHKKDKNSGGAGLPLKTENFEYDGEQAIFTLSEAAVNIVLVMVDNIPMNGTAGAPIQYRMNSPTELEILDEMIYDEDIFVSITYNFIASESNIIESIFVPAGKRLVIKHPNNDNPAMQRTQQTSDGVFGFIDGNLIMGYYLGGDLESAESYDPILGG